MKRILMQAYVNNSAEAVALYQKAFDAVLVSEYTLTGTPITHAHTGGRTSCEKV